MTVYALYMFNPTGQCIFQKLYQGAEKRLSDHERQLIFGFIFQVKRMANALAPRKMEVLENQLVLGYSTDQYRMHIFESMTGIRIALMTDPEVPEQQAFLKEVYALFVEQAVKNPMYRLYDAIRVDTFRTKFDVLISSQSYFK